MSTARTLEWVVLFMLMILTVGYWWAWRRARTALAVASAPDHSARRALRRRMLSLRQDDRSLHDTSDTKQLVLQAAISMLDADRGLLLGRDDADGDGNLDVICAIGFEGDPEGDAFVQRVGQRTLERDETIREANAVAMPVYISDEFDGAMICAKDRGDFDDFEDDVLLALGDHAGAALGNSKLREELRSAYVGTVRSLADAIQAKDPSVRTHSEEVARYVAAVAARLELDPLRREQLLFASLLHDVGKIGISERILLKPERLTDDEFNVIKLHPRIGHNLVAGIPALAPLAPAVLHHHERFDGSGYPAGLAGERIPLEARIIGVADSFSAMIADRPYAQGRSVPEACTELERCAGTQFDPQVVELFVNEVRAHPLAQSDEVTPLDAELAVHRDGDGHQPLGAPAYSLVDGLTLLHSPSYLLELLRAEVRRAAVQGSGVGLVLAEVSDLERINQHAGTAEGDRTLQTVAGALRSVEAATQGTACRASSRRFALVLPRGDAQSADDAARRVTSALADGPACAVSAVAWTDGEDAHSLLQRARNTLAT